MTRLADGSFIIDSMSGASRAYRVDVEAGTCTCPHFVQRLSGSGQKCKHLLAVEAELQPPTALQRMTERAEKLTDEELLRYANSKTGAPAAACWLELARRRTLVKAENEPTVDLEAHTCTCREFVERRDGKRIGVLWVTCRHLQAARKAAERPEPEAKPIPPGVLELLEGATDAERERALEAWR